jgi:hypothetical protein
MGKYDNLPDGCSYDDLPGWNDVEMFVDVYCEDCDLESTVEIVTDKSGEYEWECPKCKETYRGSLD